MLVALIVTLVMTMTCLAGELTGSNNYSVRWDAGEWAAFSGTTLDYELVRDLFFTIDVRTDYSRRSQPATRCELSINYYPSLWLLEGWCVSAGGVYRARSTPTYFCEISRLLSWPTWVRTVLSWFKRE